jgi:hypothetical protein
MKSSNFDQKVSIYTGIVEDVKDPEQLNRVKLRIASLHGSTGQTPADTLPWTKTLSPATGAGGPNQGGGGGQGGLSVAKGAAVVVLVNNDNYDDMTILGVLPVNNTGENIIGASAGGQSSMALGGLDGGSTGGKHEPATDMAKLILKDAPASFPEIKGKYPQTHINVSESGMRNILHDVGGETYQAVVHPTGTFTEMQADGNYVTYTAQNRKEAVDGSYTLGSEGNLVIATNGNLQLKAKGNILIEAEGGLSEFIAESKSSTVGQSYSMSAKAQVSIIGGSGATYGSKATTYVAGSTVQLNEPGNKSSVTSTTQKSKDEIQKSIDNGDNAKPLQEKN